VNIFFDILDTLLTEEGNPRPYAREVFLKLTEMGHDVYLWSTAGEGYAAHAAWVLGVEDVVRGYFGKRSVPEGITVDFVVDDHERYVENHSGYLVRAYDGDPWDQELLGVVEALS
jgi:phosphoserine phosphatase